MVSVSGSVMTSLTSGLYEPPHDNNPSSLTEEGFNSSSRKRAHRFIHNVGRIHRARTDSFTVSVGYTAVAPIHS
eukprot:scaffold36175_cov129-Isochrysis_galbana.AAC.1